MPAHTERDFENVIEFGLVERGGYAEGNPAEFSPESALFPAEAIAFLKASQPARWAELEVQNSFTARRFS